MIRVDVLGGLRIASGPATFEELPHQPMRAALLVLLAVDRALTRDQVLAMLWPDRDSERGRRALNQTVYELRRTLGEDVIVVAGERIAAGERLRTDVMVFQDAAAHGDAAAALELYRGPFLSGFFLAPTNEFEDWVTVQRGRFARSARKLRLQHIDALLAAGRPALALPHAVRAVEEDPLDDDYQHRLIALLVETGQRGAALGQFELYRARLVEQRLTPLEHTRALVQGLRLDPDARAATADGEPGAVEDPVPAGPAGNRPSATSPARRRFPGTYLALGALVLVTLTTVVLLQAVRTPPPPAAPVAPAAPPQLTVVSFEDASPAPRYGYLARGVTESVVHGLQRRVTRLRVVAVDRAAAGSAALATATGASGADLRLDGSVTVAGDSVRVRVRLVDGATGELLRPIEVRRAWTSELALVDSIVPIVIEQMQPVLGQQILKRDLRAGTRSAEAFALYLRALESYEAVSRLGMDTYDLHSERMLAQIDSLLAQADRADPAWARTAALRARVARTRAVIAAQADGATSSPRVDAFMRAALRHAEEAVTRGPRNADALTGRAKIRHTMMYLGPKVMAEQKVALSEGAEADLHRAVAADPHASEAWLLLSEVHYSSGDFASSYKAAFEAWKTDAFLRNEDQVLIQLALNAFELGRDQDAARWCYQGAHRFPGSTLFIVCRSYLAAYHEPVNTDSALAIMREADAMPHFTGVPTIAGLNAARALARAGHPDSARALMHRITARGLRADDRLYLEAAVFLAIGDTTTALARIREHDRRWPRLHNILRSRALAGLHNHPDYPRYPAPRP